LWQQKSRESCLREVMIASESFANTARRHHLEADAIRERPSLIESATIEGQTTCQPRLNVIDQRRLGMNLNRFKERVGAPSNRWITERVGNCHEHPDGRDCMH